MTKRVAVIGAGASGLAAIKCCLDEGLEPVCFERTDSIGGLWHYTDYSRDGEACVMKSTVINTSKEMMCYSDFPIPAFFANFMHHTKVLEYFHLYAEHFNLKKYIRFETSVLRAAKAKDFSESGRWILDVEEKETGEMSKESYDAVMVCTGHHADMNLPYFPGIENFQGQIIHSHDYKQPASFHGKRVVIIGMGNSGADAAVELSRVAAQVYLSTRRGSWVLHRIAENGLPMDMQENRRYKELLKTVLPSGWMNTWMERHVNKRCDHAIYSLKPRHRLTEAHPTINDELPNRIACGSIVVKSDIKRFTKTGVEFDDMATEEDIDVVFFATGYKFGFPFLDKSVTQVKNNAAELYKNVFPPTLAHGTLAVIGCVQPVGSIMPIAEQQSRWVTRVIKGEAKLPSSASMLADISRERAAVRHRYVRSPRHSIQVDWIPYMDEIAKRAACKPDLWRILIKDPELAVACFFGPCTPYQYRLMGTHAWDGARDAILTTWERAYKPLKTRKVPKTRYDLCRAILQVIFVLLLAWLMKDVFGF